MPITFVVFDLLRRDGVDLTPLPYSERRAELESLSLDGPTWTTSETFADGRALFAAVCEHGYEGVVAKNNASTYGSKERGWVKVKNPSYWRREMRDRRDTPLTRAPCLRAVTTG